VVFFIFPKKVAGKVGPSGYWWWNFSKKRADFIAKWWKVV